jgi:hypothetical protein
LTDSNNQQNETDHKNYSASPSFKMHQGVKDVLVWLLRQLKCLIDILNWASPLLTAIATGLLVWVAIWQWVELHSTDSTLRETAQRQLRAHVLYDGVSIVPNKTNAVVTLKLKNSGATPAYRATYWWNLKAFPTNEKGELKFSDTGDISTDVGAGGTMDTDEIEMSSSDIADAKSGKKIIYVWGLVKYLDVFQRCQVASFAFRSGNKIDYDRLLVRSFRTGGTIVSDDSETKDCKEKKKHYWIPPTISIPPN